MLLQPPSLLLFTLVVASFFSYSKPSNPRESRMQPWNSHSKIRKNQKANIVLIITDDQDVELGSMNFMPKALKIMRDGGAHFPNAYITTPMCCPSRSSLLTGMYVHNHNVYTNNDNCSSLQWQQEHETRTFATYLSNAGYRTGYFGKYLNEYNGTYIPPGWREWVGLIRNSRFYNYTINFNGKKIKHDDDYYKDYFTDLIANDSVTFLKQSKQYFPNRPVAMVLSMPAPHGPEDSAPQYQHLFENVTTHRTPSWDFAPNPDKQWILQFTGKMEPIHVAFTDLLHRKRLQTLQSVDDAVQKVYDELKNLGELDNTYIFYTSDHGYHLGQYGLIKGKAMPYEFDIKVPFYVRGPNIAPGVQLPQLVMNLDISPTMLDIAGVEPPEHMDGQSILKILDSSKEYANSYRGQLKNKIPWRDTFLIERGKITKRKLQIREKIQADKLGLSIKEFRMETECKKPEFESPCTKFQKWECRRDETGKLRMYKCRIPAAFSASVNGRKYKDKDNCVCPPATQNSRSLLSKEERKQQREFLQEHVRGDFKPRFMRARSVTESSSSEQASFLSDDVDDVDASYSSNPDDYLSPIENEAMKNNDSDWVHSPEQAITEDKVIENLDLEEENLERMEELNLIIAEKEVDKVDSKENETYSLVKRSPGGVVDPYPYLHSQGLSYPRKCRVYPNNTVVCDRDIYHSFNAWREHKLTIDEKIRFFKDQLQSLKDIRKHLKKEKPFKSDDDELFISEDDFNDNIDGICNCDEMDDTQTTLKGRHANKRARAAPFNKHDPKDYWREDRKQKKEERLQKKLQQQEKRLAKQEKKRHKFSNPHNNDPVYNPSEIKYDKKDKKKAARKEAACKQAGLECFEMDNSHWATTPRWMLGPFCFCPNSNNNTYWCIRTLNETHNYLFCEFITGFLSFYNLTADPFELRNAIDDLHPDTLSQLVATLEHLKGCKGYKDCLVRAPSSSKIDSGSRGWRSDQASLRPNRGNWRDQRRKIRRDRQKQ